MLGTPPGSKGWAEVELWPILIPGARTEEGAERTDAERKEMEEESQKNSMCRREAERASALGQWEGERGVAAGLAKLAELNIKALSVL